MTRAALLGALLLVAPLTAARPQGPTAPTPDRPPVATGLPAANEEWSGDDYTRAAELFRSGSVSLPRLSDPQGQALFQQLTATEGLERFADCRVRASERLQDFSKLMGGGGNILFQYATQLDRGWNTHAEVARLEAFLLQAAARGAVLVDEVVTLTAKDARYALPAEKVKRLRDALANMFDEAVTTLKDGVSLTAEDRAVLLDAIGKTTPTLNKILSLEARAELRGKLAGTSSRFQREEDRHQLQVVGDLLKP